MAEGRHITSLLQLETHLIDAAGSVDGKHELEIHILLRQRWDAPRSHQQRAKERSAEPTAQRTVHLVRSGQWLLRCAEACTRSRWEFWGHGSETNAAPPAAAYSPACRRK